MTYSVRSDVEEAESGPTTSTVEALLLTLTPMLEFKVGSEPNLTYKSGSPLLELEPVV